MAVGHIAAFVGEQQSIFADGGEIHILMRQAAAHHAHIRANRNGGQPAAVKDIEISLVVSAVLLVKPVFIGVQTVAVLHSKFTHADEAGARTRVIAPFGLNVIDQTR